ncbi:methyltransferase [Mycobacterium phage Reptar3000]|nr:methyltransferase [Mycobacterium phage Reptar3000]
MTVYYADSRMTLYHGDAYTVADGLASGSVDSIVTSPPYFGLRNYGQPGQYGIEATPAEYVEKLRKLFGELRRVLADDGTLWLNLGDTYKGKNLLGMPWRVALALQDDGWILRNDVVWQKPNAAPQSSRDRLTGRYEHVFLFVKQSSYWFDLDPIRVKYDGDRAASRRARSGRVNKANSVASEWKPDDSKGRNPGDVWTIPTTPFPGSHFATFPQELPRRCILAGCKPGGVVLDPFHGSGTTGLVALGLGRRYVGIELNAAYLDLSLTHPKRLAQITTEVAS